MTVAVAHVMPTRYLSWNPDDVTTPDGVLRLMNDITAARRELAAAYPSYSVGHHVLVTATNALCDLLCSEVAKPVIGANHHYTDDPPESYGQVRRIIWSWVDLPDGCPPHTHPIAVTAVGDDIVCMRGQTPLAPADASTRVKADMVIATLATVQVWAAQLRQAFAGLDVSHRIEVTADQAVAAAAWDSQVWTAVQADQPRIGTGLQDWSDRNDVIWRWAYDAAGIKGNAQHVARLSLRLPSLATWQPGSDQPPPGLLGQLPPSWSSESDSPDDAA